jgi:hypothetical protein
MWPTGRLLETPALEKYFIAKKRKETQKQKFCEKKSKIKRKKTERK